ncbi:origin recognition complex subunit 1-like [Uloborus diversus]|uniref:origin recognition complex subunit 1-like n=1 Tax=Uloborus diversus TaxID=327109 RepID=UPI00240A13C2|nr:origin recognition complex subunit 1-like [Uloborus diversus]
MTQDWCRTHFPDLISSAEWPPYSPDLSSMDYSVWSILEAKVCAKPHKNLEALKQSLRREWARLLPEDLWPIAENFREYSVTRSGRKVKSINYYEEKREYSAFASPKLSDKFSKLLSLNDSDSDESDFHSIDSSSSDDSITDSVPLDKKKSRSRQSVKRPSSVRKKDRNLNIPERKTPLKTPQNVLEESRQRLHVSAVPKSLPCREEEYSDIYTFVKGCLCAQTGGCMYISGVPGTGKTATVHEVVRNLEEEKETGEIPVFSFVEVNGMWMTDPYQCYVHIFKSLTGKTIAPQQAASLLEKHFTEPGPKKDAVVLLVDELDRLWTRKQTVMYNIFDWPTKKHSKLIVLAIANTMDLPERMMMNRIASRLGLTRKTFQPYNFRQLQEIIMTRIQELKVFDPDAVQLVARKVAAVSGDARRALDICRFATEVTKVKVSKSPKKGQKSLVGMQDVDIALQQMFSSPLISAIKSSSVMAKIFFRCILSEFSRTGSEETTLLKVYQQMTATCRFEGLTAPTSSEVSSICGQLAASHLILVDNFRNDLHLKIRLNVSSDDVNYALTGR